MKKLTLAVATLAGLAACASVPLDTSALDRASSAVDRANDAGSVEYAPLELRAAREKLAEARIAAEERNGDLANRLAAESLVSAELALAKSDAARARERTRAQRESNQQLRQELQTDSGREQ
ncbi:MAG: DUF4398 domain-containing protein [Xanthomonadales bacterium]|nr:DUF4398 domain-containing protein [Xanthomonadales bacterium]